MELRATQHSRQYNSTLDSKYLDRCCVVGDTISQSAVANSAKYWQVIKRGMSYCLVFREIYVWPRRPQSSPHNRPGQYWQSQTCHRLCWQGVLTTVSRCVTISSRGSVHPSKRLVQFQHSKLSIVATIDLTRWFYSPQMMIYFLYRLQGKLNRKSIPFLLINFLLYKYSDPWK